MRSKLTQEEIENILTQDNLVVRNLQITLGYYRISRGLRKLVGDKDVNWFAFGCYASKTAGQALRHELLPGPLKSAMIRSAGYDNTYMYLDEVLRKSNESYPVEVANLLGEVLTQVSLLISAGNIMIFEELGWPFTCLIDRFSNDWQRDDAKFQDLLDEFFQPGQIEQGGQDLLIEAFSSFYNARFETDPKRKSEYILLANLLTGYHEQTRLQTVIEKAIAVPFDVFTAGLLPEEDNDHPDSVGNIAKRKTIGFSRKLVLKTVTRMWMSYALPTRELKLGKNVVAPTGLVNYPPELLTIENPRCRELIAQFGTGTDTLSGSAAKNWGILHDRMNFLVDFFRSYLRYKQLFDPPFLESQIPLILAGQVPSGPL